MKPLYIYNIFPRLYQDASKWTEAMLRAKEMGFNAIFLNSVLKCGESGSIYSISDYFDFDPLSFGPEEEPRKALSAFLERSKGEGMQVFMDLVINHTAADHPFTRTRPEWYVRGLDGEIKHASTMAKEGIVTWEDSAWLNYQDRCSGLWDYMLEMCRYYLDLGFAGFRCDAAAHVSAEFWSFLIDQLRQEDPDIPFLGEAFLSSDREQEELAKAGFDYVFTSAKWWDYEQPWLFERRGGVCGSLAGISFPENHDTERLMWEVGGCKERYLQRLIFTGCFSKGFMITSGFEYGFTKKIDVCATRREDWENTGQDYSGEIRKLLELKRKYPALGEDGDIRRLYQDERVAVLLKTYQTSGVLLLLNKSMEKTEIETLPLRRILWENEFYHEAWEEERIPLKPYDILLYPNREGMEFEGIGYKNRAAILTAPGRLILGRKWIPAPGEMEVLVKVEACGICGSDFYEYTHGPFYWLPTCCGGHEFTGTAYQIGNNVSKIKRGDRVAFLLPREGRAVMHGGGFAEYAIVKAQNLFVLPQKTDLEKAVMIEPLAVAVHAGRRARGEKGIAVIGSGTIARLLARYLRKENEAAGITLVLKHFQAGEPDDPGIRILNWEQAGKEQFDLVYECGGSRDSFASAYDCTREGGRLIVLGIYEKEMRINMTDVMFCEKRIEGCFLYDDRDFAEAAQLFSEEKVKTGDLITHRFELEAVSDAFSVPSRERIKVIVRCGRTGEQADA